MTTTMAEMLDALWACALTKGVERIAYQTPNPVERAQLRRGLFRAKRRPFIWIYRDGPPPEDKSRPDLAGPHVHDDLLTLAHEFGHFLSWKGAHCGRDRDWRAYFAATEQRDVDAAKLTQAQKALIFADEERAWRSAACVLQHLRYADWPTFSRRRDAELDAYRAAMSSQGRWPGIAPSSTEES